MTTKKLAFGRYDYAAFLTFSAYSGCSVIIPLALVKMKGDLGFSLSQGGALQVIRSVSMVVAMVYCGVAAGKYGKRKTMGVSSLFMALGILACAVSQSYLMLLPMLLITGLGEGIIEGIATPFVQQLHVDESGRYVNIAHSFWSVGMFATVLGAGALLNAGVHWRLVMGLVGILSLMPMVFYFWPESPGREYPETQEVIDGAKVARQAWAILSTPRFWVYLAIIFLNGGCEFCLSFWSASFIQLNFAGSAWAGGIGTALVALGMFIGRTCSGIFVPQDKLKHLMLGSSILCFPATIPMAFLRPEAFDNPNTALYILYVLLFVGGLGVACFWPTSQVYATERLPHLDPTMIFVIMSCSGIPGCGIFSWLMGVLGDTVGLDKSFFLVPITAGLIGVIIAIEGFLLKEKPKSGSVP